MTNLFPSFAATDPADLHEVDVGSGPALSSDALAALRSELDRIDVAVHDLLRHRADVVGQIANLGVKRGSPLRPGREAAIIRGLLSHHTGKLPRAAIVRIWREIMAGMTAIQGAHSVAVCDESAAASFAAAAREHFGALTPLRVYRTPAQAIAEVSRGSANAAVLPMPADGELPSAAWWTALLHKDDPRILVIARLPFWAPRPDGAPQAQALVVGAVPPDPSGSDRSLIGLELPLDVSRARLSTMLTDAGLSPGPVFLRRDPGADVANALTDVDGFLTDRDPRLAAIRSVLRPPVVLGAYAIPLDSETRA